MAMKPGEYEQLIILKNAVDEWWTNSDRGIWAVQDEELSATYQEFLHWLWKSETLEKETK